MIALCIKIIYVFRKLKGKLKYMIEKIKYFFVKKEYSQELNENYDSAYDTVSRFRMRNNNSCSKINLEEKIDLSIIIPVYNAEKYIKKCIDSIINQSTKYKIEVICVNDGSTDNSLQILKLYNDNRLRIYTQDNSGAAKARNMGINLAIGKYIMFVDSDDFIVDSSINILLDTAYNRDADIVAGNIKKYIERFNILISSKSHKSFETSNLLKMCNNTEGAPWGKIYKKSLWDEVRFHEGYAFEDCIIFLNIYPKVENFVYINNYIYCFRTSNSSLFKRSLNEKKCIDSFWGVLASYEMIPNKEIITNSYIQLFVWHLSAIMYERIKDLSSLELKKALICLSKELIFKILNNKKIKSNIFEGKNSILYNRLIEVLKTGTLKEWEQISKIILLSGEI